MASTYFYVTVIVVCYSWTAEVRLYFWFHFFAALWSCHKWKRSEREGEIWWQWRKNPQSNSGCGRENEEGDFCSWLNFSSFAMPGKDGKELEEYDSARGILSPTLTVDEKADEEVYKEAFDHFDGNHSKTIPTSVSWQKPKLFERQAAWIFILSPEPNLRATKSWAESNRGGDSGHDQPGVNINFIMFSCHHIILHISCHHIQN